MGEIRYYRSTSILSSLLSRLEEHPLISSLADPDQIVPARRQAVVEVGNPLAVNIHGTLLDQAPGLGRRRRQARLLEHPPEESAFGPGPRSPRPLLSTLRIDSNFLNRLRHLTVLDFPYELRLGLGRRRRAVVMGRKRAGKPHLGVPGMPGLQPVDLGRRQPGQQLEVAPH